MYHLFLSLSIHLYLNHVLFSNCNFLYVLYGNMTYLIVVVGFLVLSCSIWRVFVPCVVFRWCVVVIRILNIYLQDSRFIMFLAWCFVGAQSSRLPVVYCVIHCIICIFGVIELIFVFIRLESRTLGFDFSRFHCPCHQR